MAQVLPLLLAAALLSALGSCTPLDTAPRRLLEASAVDKIAGGGVAARGQFPFYAALHGRPGYFDPITPQNNYCGGSLIAPNVVMSAAHCTYNCDGSNHIPKYITIGGTSWNDTTAVTAKVKKMYRHPGYSDFTMGNDVVLFELEQPVEGIRPAKLAKKNLALRRNQQLTVCGLGETPTQWLSPILLYTTLKFVPFKNCQRATYGLTPPTALCAGSLGIEDSCPGDSGGPLLVDPETQVGIVSYGFQAVCGNSGDVGGYTDVRLMRPWIEETLKKIQQNAGDKSRDEPLTALQEQVAEQPTRPKSKSSQNKIGGGKFASEGQFPWSVAIFQRYHDFDGSTFLAHDCSASLIAPDVVLTAARCITNCRGRVYKPAFVRMNTLAADNKSAVKRKVTDIRIHPKFWYRLHYYDIALMKLDKPVRGVPLAGLASPSTVLKPNQKLTVMGWGGMYSQGQANLLRYTNVRYVPDDQCKGVLSYMDLFDDTVMCAGSLYVGKVCPGDGGAPLVTEDGPGGVQVGIASMDSDPGFWPTCDFNTTAAYTDVRALRGWIDATVEALEA